MDEQLLTDLRLEELQRDFRPIYRVAGERRAGPGAHTVLQDLAIVSGRENLAQAIIMRLLTPQGELASLGHPSYGSRLHELVGEVNTDSTLNRMRLSILEALREETRIARIAAVAVQPSPGRRSSADVAVTVVPVGSAATVTIGPFTLEL